MGERLGTVRVLARGFESESVQGEDHARGLPKEESPYELMVLLRLLLVAQAQWSPGAGLLMVAVRPRRSSTTQISAKVVTVLVLSLENEVAEKKKKKCDSHENTASVQAPTSRDVELTTSLSTAMVGVNRTRRRHPGLY